MDKRSGKMRWKRTAAEGEPLNKRHIKSTYASASPATDGRLVVAWFGSQGLYAYELRRCVAMEGRSRARGHGAYDIPRTSRVPPSHWMSLDLPHLRPSRPGTATTAVIRPAPAPADLNESKMSA